MASSLIKFEYHGIKLIQKETDVSKRLSSFNEESGEDTKCANQWFENAESRDGRSNSSDENNSQTC